MLKPKIKLHRITCVTPSLLKKHNIKALLLDVDNTLSTHHGTTLVDGLEEWLSVMHKEGIKICILSNSKEKRVMPFAEKIGLDFVSLACKPLPFGFLKAIKKMKVKRKETALIGDQIFTDVIGGNLMGVKTIMTDLILAEDKMSFRVRRYLEKKLLKKMKVENGYGC